MTNQETADILSREFTNNFSKSSGDNNTMQSKSSDRSLNELNEIRCAAEDILRVLKYCPYTAAGPESFLFALIKELIQFII